MEVPPGSQRAEEDALEGSITRFFLLETLVKIWPKPQRFLPMQLGSLAQRGHGGRIRGSWDPRRGEVAAAAVSGRRHHVQAPAEPRGPQEGLAEPQGPQEGTATDHGALVPHRSGGERPRAAGGLARLAFGAVQAPPSPLR